MSGNRVAAVDGVLVIIVDQERKEISGGELWEEGGEVGGGGDGELGGGCGQGREKGPRTRVRVSILYG